MKVVLITGAGVSAESGLSTFRSDDGLWDQNNLDRVCNLITWKQNFKAVHAFYNNRRTELLTADPNDFHKEVVKWEWKYDLFNLTQNVDNLFEKAGCQEVIHLHGFLSDMKCLACGKIFDIGLRPWDIDNDRCACGSRKGVKPGVVFFNEDAPLYTKLYRTIRELTQKDVVVVAGTSGVVLPLSSLLFDAPGKKIYMDIREADWATGIFDHYVIGPVTQTVGQVSELLKQMNC